MKKICLYPSNKEITYLEGESVLATLEKNGLALPNNCRAGACGECKVKVRKGTFDQGFVLDMALSPEERAGGYGLMCMAKPTSEVLEIEFADEKARPKLFAPEENRQFMVIEKQMVTGKICKLKLRSLNQPMRFWPGQFVRMGDMTKNIPYKSYSIASLPNSSGEIELFITKVSGGMTSQWIHRDLNVGEKVKINGPYGTFIGDPTAETPVLCLAAGSGLAPILSLASAALLRGGFRYPATIIFSAQTSEDVYESGLLKFLEAKFRHFRFLSTFTQEKKEGSLSGRIPELLPTMFTDLSIYSIYIAGSEAFVEDCKRACLKLGADPNLMHLEGFSSKQ